jgi:hypothetical protein
MLQCPRTVADCRNGIGAANYDREGLAEWEGESSNQPAVAAPQLWRGTHFSNASSRLAAPKRQRRRVAERVAVNPR